LETVATKNIGDNILPPLKRDVFYLVS